MYRYEMPWTCCGCIMLRHAASMSIIVYHVYLPESLRNLHCSCHWATGRDVSWIRLISVCPRPSWASPPWAPWWIASTCPCLDPCKGLVRAWRAQGTTLHKCLILLILCWFKLIHWYSLYSFHCVQRSKPHTLITTTHYSFQINMTVLDVRT